MKVIQSLANLQSDSGELKKYLQLSPLGVESIPADSTRMLYSEAKVT